MVWDPISRSYSLNYNLILNIHRFLVSKGQGTPNLNIENHGDFLTIFNEVMVYLYERA
jgi:hypothetical protein